MKCDQCKKTIGWQAAAKVAVTYTTADGPAHLCSAKCDAKWIEARAARPQEPAK